MKRLPLFLVIAGAAFAFVSRIVLPWFQTFTADGVNLNTPDAYVMLRYADTFPYPISQDAFTHFPLGSPAFGYTVWPMLAAVSARMCHLDNITMLAILPPVAFFLAGWYIYTATRRLYGSLTAAGAFFTLCLLPGEILNRTMLGAGDYHCWEILLVSCIMSLAVQAIQESSVTGKVLMPIGITVACAIYWLSWAGAPVVLLIFALAAYAWLMLSAPKHRILTTLAGIALAAGLMVMNPGLARSAASVLVPNLTEGTTEAMPLFFTDGQIDLGIIMGYFGVTFYIMLLGFGWLAYLVYKNRRKEDLLLLSWSAVMFAMTLGQRRFDYYFAVNVAILTSLVVVNVISRFQRKHLTYAAAVVFLVLCLPLAKQSISLAVSDYGRVPSSWQQACSWLKAQSPNTLEYTAGTRPAYGVFSWWSYGYWLVSLGHQATYCDNGNQDSYGASAILLSQDNSASLNFLATRNFKYLVIDRDMFRSHGLQDVPLEQTFMYQAYTGQIPQARLAFQSGQVRVFDVTIAAGKSP